MNDSKQQCPYNIAGRCDFEALGDGTMMCIRQPFCKHAFNNKTCGEVITEFAQELMGRSGDVD